MPFLTNHIRNYQRNYHIRQYVYELDETIFVRIVRIFLLIKIKVCQERIRVLETLPMDCNRHLGLIIYPMKYEFGRRGCTVTRISKFVNLIKLVIFFSRLSGISGQFGSLPVP